MTRYAQPARLLLAAALAPLASQAFAAPPPLAGQEWILGSGGPVIAFEPCGSELCGRIVSLPAWKGASTDVKNPDPALRNRPLCGLVAITGLTASKDEWVNGMFYAAPHGKSVAFAVRAGKANPVGLISGMMPFTVRLGFLPVNSSTPRTCPR